MNLGIEQSQIPISIFVRSNKDLKEREMTKNKLYFILCGWLTLLLASSSLQAQNAAQDSEAIRTLKNIQRITSMQMTNQAVLNERLSALKSEIGAPPSGDSLSLSGYLSDNLVKSKDLPAQLAELTLKSEVQALTNSQKQIESDFNSILARVKVIPTDEQFNAFIAETERSRRELLVRLTAEVDKMYAYYRAWFHITETYK